MVPGRQRGQRGCDRRMGDKVTDSGVRQYSDTVIAATSLGLVWLGDALIYVVLPLYPAAFGVETASVAILLSVNRVIRIIGYGWGAPPPRPLRAHTPTPAARAAAAPAAPPPRAVAGFWP